MRSWNQDLILILKWSWKSTELVLKKYWIGPEKVLIFQFLNSGPHYIIDYFLGWKCSAFDVIFFQEQHRQEVGEQVYPLVEKLAGSEAGLVTGMLLTLDITIVEEAVEQPEVWSLCSVLQ